MKTSEVLNAAADLLQVRGWSQGGDGWHPKPGSTTPLCMEGALKVALGPGVFLRVDDGLLVYRAVVDYLTSTSPECINSNLGEVIPFSWNDQPSRTQDDVVAALRAAAAIEEARESARGPLGDAPPVKFPAPREPVA